MTAVGGAATCLLNRAQAGDLAAKGPGYLGMFHGLGGPVAVSWKASSW